jgi:UDP-N-acetylmuramate dehydrogenase
MTGQELKDIFSGSLFEGEVKFDEPMSSHTSLRMGGPADVYAIPRDIFSLVNISLNLEKNHIHFFTIGGGTNILVRDGGVEGVVLSTRLFKKILPMEEDNTSVLISVGAGALLLQVIIFARENGYSGVEGLAGIPGTVGGAIFGNAGAFGYEIKDVLTAVKIMDTEGGIKTVTADTVNFGYRSSGILPGNMILSAEMRLRKDTKEIVAARARDFLKMKQERQPLWEPSAGCVFKNPPGESAGKLIDAAECKGVRIGDVEVSNVHANFFINKGGRAKASDFIRLMDVVAHRVKKKYGVILEPEIKIVGREEVAEG